MIFGKIIEGKKVRCDKLHELLADPKVIANASEYQGYAKELSALMPIVNAYNEYLRISHDLKGLDKILNEKNHANDKEFLVLAEEEKREENFFLLRRIQNSRENEVWQVRNGHRESKGDLGVTFRRKAPL